MNSTTNITVYLEWDLRDYHQQQLIVVMLLEKEVKKDKQRMHGDSQHHQPHRYLR